MVYKLYFTKDRMNIDICSGLSLRRTGVTLPVFDNPRLLENQSQ